MSLTIPSFRSAKGSALTRPGGRLARAVGDLHRGLTQSELWLTLGWHDIQRRYRRSTLGPFWLTLSMAATIAGIGLLYASLFQMDVGVYLPQLAFGLIVWGLIASVMNDGCSAFIDASQTIKQIRAPLSVYIYRMMWRNTLIFGHNVVLVPVVMLVLGVQPGLAALMALPGLVIVLLTFCAVSISLAVLSARFRDIPLIISTVIQFAFFFTPIIWDAEMLPERALIVEANPFYYMLEIIRRPLLGEVPPAWIWLVSLGLCVTAWALALTLYAKFRGRIAFWV